MPLESTSVPRLRRSGAAVPAQVQALRWLSPRLLAPPTSQRTLEPNPWTRALRVSGALGLRTLSCSLPHCCLQVSMRFKTPCEHGHYCNPRATIHGAGKRAVNSGRLANPGFAALTLSSAYPEAADRGRRIGVTNRLSPNISSERHPAFKMVKSAGNSLTGGSANGSGSRGSQAHHADGPISRGPSKQRKLDVRPGSIESGRSLPRSGFALMSGNFFWGFMRRIAGRPR